MTDPDHLRVAMFTDLLVYDYSGAPPEHPDDREVSDLRKQSDWLIERGWTNQRMTTEETRMTDPEYRLYLDHDRTILLRIWDTGQVELATRPDPGAVWGPPTELTEEPE